MTSVSTNTAPVMAAGITLAALDDAPAQAGGAAKASGAGAAGDVLLGAALEKTSVSKSSKSTKSTKTSSTKKKSTSASSKSGYASSSSLPKDLSFLRDPKLSVEEKLMRFLAYMNAKYEADVTAKMEAMGGGVAAKSGSSGGGSGGTTKAKKKGFWGSLLDAAKTAVPALGLSMQVLKNPTTKAMLKQLGGPVLGAAAAAFGFPAAGPMLAKLGPQIVDYAAAGLQAIEKAAAAEQKGSSGATTSGGSSSAKASGTADPKSEQLQMLELNRAVDKQKEMFLMVSNMLKSWHDTRSHIINNLR